jgi:tripartite motif-containing protein 71
MRRFLRVLAAVLVVAAGVAASRVVNVSASVHGHALAAKTKCKTGYHRVHGKCKKKHAVAPTPVPTAIPALLNHPGWLALDAQGNLYVTEGWHPETDAEGQRGIADSRILKISPSGQLLATLATSGSAPGQFLGATGITLDALGNIYAADFFNDRIQKLSPTGQPLAAWGTRGSGPGHFMAPIGLAVDTQGNIYAADTGSANGPFFDHRIHKLSPTGQELAVWGTLGSGPGQFIQPTGIAVDAQGNLYVADAGNHRVQKLSPTGQPLAAWGTFGTGPGQFNFPSGIALDAQGNIYITDRLLNRIQKLSPTGQVLAVWDSSKYGFTGNTPFGIAVDGQGDVFVADFENSRILKLSPSGEVLATFK